MDATSPTAPSAQPQAVEEWTRLLAEFEAELDEVDAALDDDRAPVLPVWQVPAGLGPLPDALAVTATEVMRRLEAVQEAATRRCEELQEQLSSLGRRRDAGHAYAAAGPAEHDVDDA